MRSVDRYAIDDVYEQKRIVYIICKHLIEMLAFSMLEFSIPIWLQHIHKAPRQLRVFLFALRIIDVS